MNKYRTLAVNTIVFAIGSFGSKILSFFLNYLYTGNMDSSMYYTKEALEITANFLIPVVTFSITDAVIRYGLDRNYEKRSVFSNAIAVELFGILAFLLLSPLLLLYPDVRDHVPLLVGYVCISAFRQLSTQFARARGLVRLYAADGIFCTLMLFLFNLLFVGHLQWGVTGFMLAVMLSDLCSGTLVWLIAGHSRYFSFRFVDRELLQVMTRFSLPLIPTALLWIVTGFSDRIFIRHMVDAAAAGVYGAAAKVPNLISMVSTIFYQAWNMSAIAENDSEGRAKFYSQVYNAYQSLLVLAAGFLIALVKPFSSLINNTDLDASYGTAYLFTPMLIVAVLLMCLNQFLSSIYTVSKHTANSFYTSLVAAALNLLFNALLIPKYGVHGAIAATFISYFVCYVIRLFDARRYIPFAVSHLRFAVNLGLLFAMCAVAVNEPAWLIPFQAGAFLLLAAVNFRSLMDTATKLLRR